jgi:hypothetical protein
MKNMTLGEVLALMDPETREQSECIIRRWVDRGDGVAVYENHAMDSRFFGHKKFVSFGSTEAQLEVDDPPERLPDIGGQINWAYTLVGGYRRCCERDDDGNGNCDVHERRGVMRPG